MNVLQVVTGARLDCVYTKPGFSQKRIQLIVGFDYFSFWQQLTFDLNSGHRLKQFGDLLATQDLCIV